MNSESRRLPSPLRNYIAALLETGVSYSIPTTKNVLAEEGLIASVGAPRSFPNTAPSLRLTFARKYVKTPQIWERCIFSDESDLFPYKSGKLFIRRYPGERPLALYQMLTK